LLDNYLLYAKTFHKIRTKVDGVQPFRLRKYQIEFINKIQAIKGPKRVIVLKPRQAGFTTVVSSFFTWKFCTTFNYKGIGIADQYSRTLSMSAIYSNFIKQLDPKITPSVGKDNDERIDLNIMGSGVEYLTARDKNAGRAGTRQFAHLTEAAFYLYPDEIDEGIQNSIPLSENSFVIKESTANGKQGVGKAFYDLWMAASLGESLYIPFFVAWYEVDDYAINPPVDFKPTEMEKQILDLEPSVSIANLTWRRLKLSEYRTDSESQSLSPEERFKQDFPLSPEEAFLNSGRPVYDQNKLNKIISDLRKASPKNLVEYIKTTNNILKSRLAEFKIFSPPRDNRQYFIGADISEGLEIGDSSSICVMDHELGDVAYWHGKIDPDLLGHLLIGLAEMYNNALIIPEKNNMGHTTVTTIKNQGYYNIYKKIIEDKITKEKRTELGWRTTSQSKAEMLNESIKLFREGSFIPRDINLAMQMANVSRGPNGEVELNGLDRVVAMCLALMGAKHYRLPINNIKKQSREFYDIPESNKSGDIFG